MTHQPIVDAIGTHAAGREVERILHQLEFLTPEHTVEAARNHEADVVAPIREPVRRLYERRNIPEVGGGSKDNTTHTRCLALHPRDPQDPSGGHPPRRRGEQIDSGAPPRGDVQKARSRETCMHPFGLRRERARDRHRVAGNQEDGLVVVEAMKSGMSRLLVVAVVVAVAVVAGACGTRDAGEVRAGESASKVERTPGGDGESSAAARAVNDFAVDLLRVNLGVDKGNVAMSPWSIATALAMARVGARGDTATDMARVLHVGDEPSYDQAMNALDQVLRGRNRTTPMGNDEPQIVDLSAANRLFAQRGLTFVPDFLDALAAHYGAAVGEVDYKTDTEAARRAINEWVAAETRDKIPALIGEGQLDTMSRLVLANAVFLRADWAIPFDKNATADGPFHAPSRDETVPFMRATERWEWSEGDGWRAVELPYTGGELAMTFVVPDAGEFDRFTTGFDHSMLERIVSTQPAQVRLRLPKFTIDKSVLLGEQLRPLGMQTAFSDTADFTGITIDEPLQIAEVAHQAKLTVDEKGTVAAAATAVMMRTTSGLVGEPKTLDIDRPFLFFLRDRPTGALLFAGQVTNPA